MNISDHNSHPLEGRLRRLERRLRFQNGIVLFLLLFVCALCASAWKRNEPEVLRVKGLVVLDDKGRDRILMGAPVPESTTRKSKERAHFIALVDENGQDRLAIGETKGYFENGKWRERERAYSYRIVDLKGDERGGLGTFDSGKAICVLDRARPDSDGVGLMVDDSLNYVGFVANHKKHEGNYVQAIALGVQNGSCFFSFDDPAGRRRLSMQLGKEGEPAAKILGLDGKSLRDAFKAP